MIMDTKFSSAFKNEEIKKVRTKKDEGTKNGRTKWTLSAKLINFLDLK